MIHPIYHQIVNLPNFISLIRICLAPLLFYFALTQQPDWFIIVLVGAIFTDVLDGFLARILNQITSIGSRLDSWGDFIIYSTMAICAWILWPDILLRKLPYFIVITLSFTLPVLVGFIKFHTVISYHTWSVKIAVVITVLGYILLFTGLVDWPFRLAAAFCVYAAIEEIAITLLSQHQLVDVRTVWQALKFRQRHKIDHV
ncbi:CDP-alcohol phosphatidyltransferase family protein [Nitrosomonas sp. JL21]|uniref:CDP-alcohol phosphatidyltransferase family protein n=1 Tax=Nitrosomonas sp. JL21 TaxID=153949 RepID=UPI00136D6164|nr:CDP-alcohol phosphatidyltransferase family protein [Nitrosomonas sp. JL21]MBL8497561.1 CDP-alcohol phosphatidyltransferase family protein [Nitrosomonas sp.]MXS78614.1 CDP-alcohol phosphatidyltransferase family protein [Nitrosomonas sp. JL21]